MLAGLDPRSVALGGGGGGKGTREEEAEISHWCQWLHRRPQVLQMPLSIVAGAIIFGSPFRRGREWAVTLSFQYNYRFNVHHWSHFRPHTFALIKDKGLENPLVLLVTYPCSFQANLLHDQST